ncbi:unannotated protein [freshwater metagenome]|uniref:Unannotated protein n=1 Tax=freshwater metagenome TaxID=449393 RepID=A0A6J6ERV5_9ZZZZ
MLRVLADQHEVRIGSGPAQLGEHPHRRGLVLHRVEAADLHDPPGHRVLVTAAVEVDDRVNGVGPAGDPVDPDVRGEHAAVGAEGDHLVDAHPSCRCMVHHPARRRRDDGGTAGGDRGDRPAATASGAAVPDRRHVGQLATGERDHGRPPVPSGRDDRRQPGGAGPPAVHDVRPPALAAEADHVAHRPRHVRPGVHPDRHVDDVGTEKPPPTRQRVVPHGDDEHLVPCGDRQVLDESVQEREHPLGAVRSRADRVDTARHDEHDPHVRSLPAPSGTVRHP